LYRGETLLWRRRLLRLHLLPALGFGLSAALSGSPQEFFDFVTHGGTSARWSAT